MRKYGSAKDAFFANGIQLISECGYENLSISRICQASNASNGSFFHHFGSKSRFAGELYLNVLEDYQDTLAKAVDTTCTPQTAISSLIKTHITWVIDNKEEASFLLDHPSAEALAAVKSEANQLNIAFQLSMSSWYENQCELETIHPLPLSLFYFQLIGPAQMICRHWLSNPDSPHPLDHQTHLIECAIRALTTSTQD